MARSVCPAATNAKPVWNTDGRHGLLQVERLHGAPATRLREGISCLRPTGGPVAAPHHSAPAKHVCTHLHLRADPWPPAHRHTQRTPLPDAQVCLWQRAGMQHQQCEAANLQKADWRCCPPAVRADTAQMVLTNQPAQMLQLPSRPHLAAAAAAGAAGPCPEPAPAPLRKRGRWTYVCCMLGWESTHVTPGTHRSQ